MRCNPMQRHPAHIICWNKLQLESSIKNDPSRLCRIFYKKKFSHGF